MIEFSYVILQYMHDTVAAECMNVGILLVAPANSYIDCRFDRHTGRLSTAFRGFDPTFYRAAMKSLGTRVAELKSHGMSEQPMLFPFQDAGRTIRALWPDLGLNYRASDLRSGTADSPGAALDLLFDRFVTSQAPDRRPRTRRDDEDVWRKFQSRLPHEVVKRLRPCSVVAGPFTFRFEHAFENGILHVIEPLSFDMLEPESMRDKSMRWIGYSHHLRPYVGTLRIVVEGPDRDEVQPAYRAVLEILRDSVEVYESDHTDRLASDLKGLMS